MRKKIAALYNPYLDLLGGGEKHTLSIMKALEAEGYEIRIFWDFDVRREIAEKLNITFHTLQFIPNVFKKRGASFKKLSILSQCDIFLYVTNGSYFFSSAKQNFVYCMVPDKNLYKMNTINKIKTANYRFIAISQFTKRSLTNQHIKSDLLYPYLDEVFFKKTATKKTKLILCVGRFFKHLHSKRHDIAIKAFKTARKLYPEFKGYSLIITGGLKYEDRDYFNELKRLAGRDKSITILPNLPFKELLTLYRKAPIFWHFAGYEIDEEKNPELVEHLGITPLEAQATKCITLCYNAGGIKELIKDGVNGYTFNTLDELVLKTRSLINDPLLQKQLQTSSIQFAKDNFRWEIFRGNVQKIFIKEAV